MLVIYLGCLLLFLYYVLTNNNHSYWASRGAPFEKPFLFFGNFFKIVTGRENLPQMLSSIYNKYKTLPYVGFFIFRQPAIMLRSPDLIKKILVKDFDKFLNRDFELKESADPYFFHNLASATDSTWKFLRTKMSPVFSSGKMKLMFPLMKECAEDLKQHLARSDGKALEITNFTKRYTVDVISSCAFGVNSNCLKNQDTEMLKMSTKLFDPRSLSGMLRMFCFFFVPSLVRLLRLSILDQKVARNFKGIFRDVMQEREKKGIVRNDLVDLLKNLKKNESPDDDYKLDDTKMAAQAILFFVAGNDTTSRTLDFVLYELAMNQDIQERLRREIEEIVEKEGEINYESLQNMNYLDMILNETLRKYSLTPFLNRRVFSDYTFEDSGLRLEKNTPVYIPLLALHFDPEYFPDPERFDPERFNDDNKRNIVPYTYLPFGDGPRNCIGKRFAQLSAKMGLAYIVKNFTLEPTEETKVPPMLGNLDVRDANAKGTRIRFTKI